LALCVRGDVKMMRSIQIDMPTTGDFGIGCLLR
jgi:hypothetical protein